MADRDRRKTSRALLATAFALVLTVAPLALAGNAYAAPNVLFIVTDDQELEGTMALMPKTTKWFNTGDAAAGITGGTEFTNGSVSTPLCCPSRSSIFSGQYAHNHGVLKNADAPNLDQSKTLQHELQLAGYRTGIFGKFLNDWDVKTNPPHWNDWAILEVQNYSPVQVNEQGAVKYNWKYSTNYVADKAEEFLQNAESNDGVPWFLYVAPTTPHGPYLPEPKYANASVPAQTKTAAFFERDRSDKPYWLRTQLFDADAIARDFPAHLRMLKTADDLVERVMQKLRSLNEDQDTLAFFISDNGYQWGEHGVRTKKYPYRESVRVPLYLRWPGWSGHSGTRTDSRLAANIDLAPTALAGAGITPPTWMDGRSLLNVNDSRARMLTEAWGGGNGTGPPCPGIFPTWAAINTQTFRYIEYYETSPVGAGGCAADDFTTNYNNVIDREYYDITPTGDPLELTNLFGDSDPNNDPPTGELSALLASARACSGGSCAQAPSDPDTRITERPASVSGSSSATFSFTSSEPNSTFECRLDDFFGSQAFLPCSSGTWSNLSNGSHRLEVRAVAAGGIRDSTPDSYTWTVDASFPETQITSGPPEVSTSRNATFEFDSSDSNATFQCRLDSDQEADFEPCSSPQSHGDLADGSHTFDVRALRSPTQMDPTPARHTWTVDATAPNTQITPASTLSTHSNIATFNIQTYVSDSSTQTETPTRLACKLDAANYSSCSTVKTYENLSKGTHTIRVRATDQAGNTDPTPAVFSWTIDTLQTFSNTTDNAWPQVTVGNEVRVVLPDGSGGYYIAGDFSEIGFPDGSRWQRTDLAHIKADKTVDEAWKPSTDSGSVRAMVAAGGVFYVGGTFTGMKGSNDSAFTSRNRLAAITTAGSLTSWNPSASNAVHALARPRPTAIGQAVTTIYAAGAFQNVGGLTRRKIAEINLTDGTVTAWNPDANNAATLQALTTNERYVYVGGSGLTQIGGKSRANLAEIDRFTGQATDWNPNPNSSVLALGLKRPPAEGLPTVYAGGPFTTIGSPPAARNRAAEINITDNGSVTAWDPSPSHNPQALYPIGCALRCTVILGGTFDELESAGGSPVARGRLADTDLVTGDPQDWNPWLDRSVSTLTCATGQPPNCTGTLAVGGLFTSSGGVNGLPLVPRGRLAFYNQCPLSGTC